MVPIVAGSFRKLTYKNARELTRKAVGVKGVAPIVLGAGHVRYGDRQRATTIIGITPEFETEIAAGTPLRRVGEPQDVADVILFLASEQARWVTGQLIYVGGGWRMHQ